MKMITVLDAKIMIKSLDAKILIQILDAKIYRKFILRRSIIEMTSTWPGLTVSERKITMGEVHVNEKNTENLYTIDALA